MKKQSPDRNDQIVEIVRDLTTKAASTAIAIASSLPAVDFIASLTPAVLSSLRKIGNSLQEKDISHLEARRASLLYHAVLNRIWERSIDGEKIREDDFIQVGFLDRTPCDEVFEATLKACTETFEEKKISFIANVFANALFTDHSPKTINAIVHQIEQRSYRQLCLVRILGDDELRPHLDTFAKTVDDQHFGHPDAPYMRNEFEQLQGRATGIVVQIDGDYQLSLNGQLGFELANLEEMDREDVEETLLVIRQGVTGA